MSLDTELAATLPDDATFWEALQDGRVGGEFLLGDSWDEAMAGLLGYQLKALIAQAGRVARAHGSPRLRLELTALREGP